MGRKPAASRSSKQKNLSKKSSSVNNTKVSNYAVDKQHLIVAKHDPQNRVKELFMDAEVSATTGNMMHTMMRPSETFFDDDTPSANQKQKRYPVISHTAGTSPSR